MGLANIQIGYQKWSLESGDFDENGKYGENSSKP